jgi:SAM-dependent methyltransferase
MQEPDFYDAAMTGDGEPAMLPLELSPWLPIYDEAARWIPSTAPVVDLGCGTGRFLARLATTTHHGRLAGVDFSPAAIAEAVSYLRGYFADDVDFCHRVRLSVEDLRDWQPDRVRETGTVYTCIEVLEHLADDLDLIRRIPAAARFVFSVPTYMSASHVRCFPNLRDVFGRYWPSLAISRWTLVDFGNGNAVHVCDSTKRTAPW